MTIWFFLVLLLKYCNSCTNGESNVYLEIWADILSRLYQVASRFDGFGGFCGFDIASRVMWSATILCLYWHILPSVKRTNKNYILKIITIICTVCQWPPHACGRQKVSLQTPSPLPAFTWTPGLDSYCQATQANTFPC